MRPSALLRRRSFIRVRPLRRLITRTHPPVNRPVLTSIAADALSFNRRRPSWIFQSFTSARTQSMIANPVPYHLAFRSAFNSSSIASFSIQIRCPAINQLISFVYFQPISMEHGLSGKSFECLNKEWMKIRKKSFSNISTIDKSQLGPVWARAWTRLFRFQAVYNCL